MADIKPLRRDSFDDYKVVTGASADTELLDHAGGMGRIQIVTAGNAGSYVALYDGTAAAGTLIGYLSGADIGAALDMDIWCGTSIHAKIVDGGGTIVTRFSGYLR